MPIERLVRIKDDQGKVLADLTPEEYAVYEQVAKEIFGKAFPNKLGETRVSQNQGWTEVRKGELWKRGKHSIDVKALSLVSEALAKIGRGTAKDVAAATNLHPIIVYRVLGLMQFLQKAQKSKVRGGSTVFEPLSLVVEKQISNLQIQSTATKE